MSQVGYGSQDAISQPFDLVVPLTGFNLSPLTNSLILRPAGTLATGTVNLPANANEGQSLKVVSNQTQTAITFVAATGDTIADSITALVANTPVEYRYSKAGVLNSSGVLVLAKTWVRVA